VLTDFFLGGLFLAVFFTHFGSYFDPFALPLTLSWAGDGNFVP